MQVKSAVHALWSIVKTRRQASAHLSKLAAFSFAVLLSCKFTQAVQ